MRILFFFFFCASQLLANPFFIHFPEKENLTDEDYLEIQRQLREINVDPLIESMYPKGEDFTHYEDIYARCVHGLKQKLIDPEKNNTPIQSLEKINEGSDMCFVSCVPFSGKYVALVQSLAGELKKLGFNGYLLYQAGGFPNPTGKEIRYVGVPYSFKIFMMLEAKKLGFNKVIWIDSAVLPLRDPTPLFTWLDQHSTLLRRFHTPKDTSRFIFPQTNKLLMDLTGTDILHGHFVNTIIFGLKMNSWQAKKIIEEYYAMAELGTPFLSCFPEEFVLSAIIGRKQFKALKKHSFDLLRNAKEEGQLENAEGIETIRKKGTFFFHRTH